MVERTETQPREPEKAPVMWVRGASPQELDAIDFPRQRLFKGRAVEADLIGGGEVGLGIFAIPPDQTPAQGFWKRFISSFIERHPEEPVPAVRLQVEPQLPLDVLEPGTHAPLSARYPHVVMDEGKYALGIWLPANRIGVWSETKVREDTNSGHYKIDKTKEEYIERSSLALLVRVDGETPLSGKEIPRTGQKEPAIQEILIGVEGSQIVEDMLFVPIDAKVIQKLGRRTAEVGFGESTQVGAGRSGLKFETIAESGTEENKVADNKGLIEVVVMSIVEEEVTAQVSEPLIIGRLEPSRGIDSPQTFRSPFDATTRGQTVFEPERRTKVSVKGVRDATPIGRVRLALVGHGGPVQAEMTEAQR